MSAAVGKETKGQSLGDVLFVPPPFVVANKEALAGERSAFMARLAQPQGSARKLGIVVSEVKAIEAARYGFKVLMKQMPDFQFMLSEDVHTRLSKRFEDELGLWNAFTNTHLLSIATFSISTTGLANIEEISLMLTDERWIPFADLNEKNLIERLIADGRHFIKGLRYNMGTDRPLACVELIDTSPRPTAMFITPGDANEDFKQALAELTDSDSLQVWVWDALSAIPMIPPRGGFQSVPPT